LSKGLPKLEDECIGKEHKQGGKGNTHHSIALHWEGEQHSEQGNQQGDE
jgi:hypothetical protein